MLNTAQEDIMQPHILSQKDFRDPFDFIYPYIVSLSKDGQTPIGSGTLVQFFAWRKGQLIKVYAILTATHVAEELGLLTSGTDVILSKPLDRTGNICATKFFLLGIAAELDDKHVKYLQQKHKGVYKKSERDVALVLLSFGELPKNAITENSIFYDLSKLVQEPLQKGDNSYYFRGASGEGAVLQDTGVFSAIYEDEKVYPKSRVPYFTYHQQDNKDHDGASGAGVWLFTKNHDATIKMCLKGVITECKRSFKETSKNTLCVTSRTYIDQILLPRTLQLIKNDVAVSPF